MTPAPPLLPRNQGWAVDRHVQWNYGSPMFPLLCHLRYAISLRALPPSPFAALNDALRRFMSLANNLPVTDRVLAWGGERPLIDAAIPSNA